MISLTPSRARRIPGMKPQAPPASAPASIIAGMTTIAGVPAGRIGDEDDRAGAPGAEQELALRADVPQPHPEGERAGETGQDQRRRLDQGVRDDPDAPEGGTDDVRVGADRVAADEGDDHRTEQQGEDERRERHDGRQPARGVGPWLEREVHGFGGRPAGRGRRRHPGCRPATGHQQPDLVDVGVGGAERADDPALVHDVDAIGQGQDLVEFLGDEQDRGPRLAPGEEDAMDGLDRPDIEAAGRLDGDHQARAGFDLAGEDQALEVAARQQPGLGVDRRRGDRDTRP